MIMTILRDNVRFVLLLLAGVFLLACGKDGDMPLTPPGEEEIPPEEVVPEVPEEEYLSPYVVSSAVMTFCYYDIEGQIDTLEQRIDFNMEVYGTDTPDLRNIPLKLVTRDGFEAENVKDGVVTMTLSTRKATRISFIKDTCTVDYDIYVTPVVKEAPATEFNIHAGVNLSYWFQEDVPWPEYETLEQIAQYGFDHVRLPFDTKVIFNQLGVVNRENMDELRQVVDRCLELGLRVILDMHWLEAGNLFYQEPAAQELVSNWKNLMGEFSKYPNEMLAYEILNEPHGPGWELMQRRMTHLIRHSEPARVLFVSPDGYNAEGASKFYLHKGDPNMIITFHYYEPMLASHRKSWGYTGPSHYPGLLFSDAEWDAMSEANREIAQWHRGNVYDYEYAYNKMKAAAETAAQNGLRLHCGEFGYSKTNIWEERVQWFRDVVKAFNDNGIVYTTWENWGGDFGPGDWASRPDEEIIGILLQKD